MKRIICVAVVMALVLTLGRTSYAQGNEQEDAYEYYQCDYESREISTYSVPVENDLQSTWELFSESDIAQMEMAVTVPESTGVSTYSIIGNDDTRAYTPPSQGGAHSSVLYIVSRFDTDGDGDADLIRGGTGFLVNSLVLVTAGYYFLPDSDDEELLEVRIYPNLDMASGASLEGQDFYYPRRWTWSTNYDNPSIRWKYNYCVVELFTPQLRTYYFNCVMSSNASTPQSVYLSGYPSDKQFRQYTSYGQLTYADTYTCRVTNDAVINGTAGGPIYGTDCIGIYTYEASTYNQGNLFTSQIYNLICNKIAENQ